MNIRPTEDGEKTDLSRDQILNILKDEISSIETKSQRTGWSIWALTGATASATWLLLSAIPSKNQDPFKPLFAFIFFSVIADIFHLAYLRQKTLFNNPQEPRFHRSAFFSHRKNLLSFLSARFFLIYLAAYFSSYSTNTEIPFSLYLYILIPFLATLSFHSLLNKEFVFPAEFKEKRGEIHPSIVNLFIISPLIYTALIYFQKLQSSEIACSMEDIKIGILLFIITELILVILALAYDPPLLLTLKRIKQDLSFGRIEPKSALEQAEIAISGLQFGDVFQQEIQLIITQIENATKDAEAISEIIKKCFELTEEVKNDVTAFDPKTNDYSKLETKHAVLVQFWNSNSVHANQHLKEAGSKVQIISQHKQELANKIAMLRTFGATFDEAFKKVNIQIETATIRLLATHDAIDKNLKLLITSNESLQTALNDLKDKIKNLYESR